MPYSQATWSSGAGVSELRTGAKLNEDAREGWVGFLLQTRLKGHEPVYFTTETMRDGDKYRDKSPPGETWV